MEQYTAACRTSWAVLTLQRTHYTAPGPVYTPRPPPSAPEGGISLSSTTVSGPVCTNTATLNYWPPTHTTRPRLSGDRDL